MQRSATNATSITPQHNRNTKTLNKTMKFSLASVIAASCLAGTSAFHVQTPMKQSQVVLNGSRSTQKKATRRAWLEKRGFGEGVATVATVETTKAGLMKNDEGLEFIKLVHPDSGASAEVYLFGGVVTSYKDSEGTDFIAVRPDAKMDGSKPISGGLSHCWPQFGNGAIQQHGFARNVMWEVTDSSDTTIELQMKPNEYTKAIWDKEFLCTFTVSLEAGELKTAMNVKNEGAEESFDFQAALHSYFTTSSLENLEIVGSFEGKEFLNKLVGDAGEMQTEERSTITITEEYDRVYKGVNDPVLKDTGSGKALNILNQAGWEDTVIWNPYGNAGMGFNNFVCVESVKFDPVTLAAGASWEGVLVLKPEAL